MAKGSTTLRQPARTATPEERAEEARRADDARWASATQVLDPAFAASVKEVRGLDNTSVRLSDGRWAPSTPAEIAAALQVLAECLDCVWDVGCNSDPSMHTLREHVLALESLVAGREVAFLADLDEDDEATSLAGRVEFQRLYRRYRAGEDAGLHQRLADTEARLAALEARLSPSPEWSPGPGRRAEEGLLEGHRLVDGSIDWSPEEATGDAIHDLGTGALRPQTWPQLLSCLRTLANSVDVLVNDHIDAEVNSPGVLKAVALLVQSAGIHR